MFAWLADIAGYFNSIWDYFLSHIETLFVAISSLADSFVFTIGLASYMPVMLSAAIYIFFAIGLLKFILGR